MIEGLQFKLTSDQVAEKIAALIEYRKKRLQLIEQEIKRVVAAPIQEFQDHINEHLEEDHGEPSYERRGSGPSPEKLKNSIVHALRVSAEGHRSALKRLEFMRETLVKDETFMVDWVELGHLFPESRDHSGLPVCFGHDHDDDHEDGLLYFGPPPFDGKTKKVKRKDDD